MCVCMQDTNADAATRDWLFNMTNNQRPGSVASNRASRRFSAFDRPQVRLSILGAFSRLASVGHRSPDLPPNEVRSMHAIAKGLGSEPAVSCRPLGCCFLADLLIYT